jgi:hypothetical protein
MLSLDRTVLILHSLLLLLFLIFVGSASASEPIETEQFLFWFDSPHHIDRADSVLNDAASRLQKLLRDSLTYKPDIYLVGDLDRFHALIGGGFPDWGAAAAIPHKKRIVIKSPDNFNLGRSMEELLAHEYSHLALAHRTGLGRAPRWFDEGLAMMTSREWNWSDNLAMSKAAVFGQFIPLDDINKVNRFNAGKAHVAYSQSYLAVDYLFDLYGQEAVSMFLDRVASGQSLDAAMMASIGSNYADFEEELGLYLRKRFNIITLFLDTMWFWLGLAVIVVIGAFVKYSKRRKYYKKWEEEERLQSTDFDYGDPDNPEQIDDEDEPWRQ